MHVRIYSGLIDSHIRSVMIEEILVDCYRLIQLLFPNLSSAALSFVLFQRK